MAARVASDGRAEVTFDEVYASSIGVASVLRNEIGSKKGDRVLLCLPNGVELIDAAFGTLYAGLSLIHI